MINYIYSLIINFYSIFFLLVTSSFDSIFFLYLCVTLILIIFSSFISMWLQFWFYFLLLSLCEFLPNESNFCLSLLSSIRVLLLNVLTNFIPWISYYPCVPIFLVSFLISMLFFLFMLMLFLFYSLNLY